MMTKHYQESELEFRRDIFDKSIEYPVIRGVIVHQYGGTLEECFRQAREEIGLGGEWKLISAESA
jgi:hypothetical protein